MSYPCSGAQVRGCFVAPTVVPCVRSRRPGLARGLSPVPVMSAASAPRPDLAVVGGGAAGLSAALAAAMDGARVTVLSRAPDQAAMRAAAGMLAPNAEAIAPGPMASLAREAREMYGEYAEMLRRVSGDDVGYVSRGDMLYPLLAGQEAPASVVAVGSRLDGKALRDVEPCLGPDVEAALRIPGDGQVDNRALFAALQKACSKLGVQMEFGADVTSVVTSADGKAVEHLVLASGERVIAAHYLVAAGAWTQRVLPNVPMVPIKGQMLCLEPRISSSVALSAAADQARLQHILFGHDAYVVPKQGGRRFFVGATVENVGFDRETTAGGVCHLLTKALRLVPQLADYHVAESWAGLRPATPDRLPVLGMSEYSNMSIASGYYRNGILLLPATAAIASAVALGTVSSLPLSLSSLVDKFSYQRFASLDANCVQSQAGRLGAEAAANTRDSDIVTAQVPRPANRREGVHPATRGSNEKASVSGTNRPRVYHIQKDGSQVLLTPGEVPAVFAQGAGDFRDPPKSAERSNAVSSSASLDPVSTPTAPAERSGEADAYEDLMKFRGKDQEKMMSEALRKNRSFGLIPHSKDGQILSLSSEEWNKFEAAYEQGIEDGVEFAADNEGKTFVRPTTVPEQPVDNELTGSSQRSCDDKISNDRAHSGEKMPLVNGKQPQVFHVQPDGRQILLTPGKLPDIFARGADDFRETQKAAEGSNTVAVASSDPSSETNGSQPRSGENDAYEDLMKHRGKDQEKMMSEALRKNRAFGRVPHSKDGPVLSLSLQDWNCFEAAYNEGLEESRSYIASLDDVVSQ